MSESLGTKTITVRSRSDPGGFNRSTKTTRSASRDLMLPEQVRQLKDTTEIAFKEGARPVMADKIRYYKERAFKARLHPPMPVPNLTIEAIQPRVFKLPANHGRRRRYGAKIPEQDGGFEPMQHTDEAAEASELAAMGHQLAALLEEESAGAADDLKAALAELEDDGETHPESSSATREAGE